MRKFLRGLSAEEWEQVLSTTHFFEVAIENSGGKAGDAVDERVVRQWVMIPKRSDRFLDFAVQGTAWQTLSLEGIDSEESAPSEPGEIVDWLATITRDELEKWLLDVASTRGIGPAKVCVLAAVEAEDSPVGHADLEVLLSLVRSAPQAPVAVEGGHQGDTVAEPTPDDEDTTEVRASMGQEARNDTGATAIPAEANQFMTVGDDQPPHDPNDAARSSAQDGSDPDLDRIEHQLISAQSAATGAAEQLRRHADDVEAGRLSALDFPQALDVYAQARSYLVEDIASVLSIHDPEDFAACQAVLDAARVEREQERRHLQARAHDLEEAIRRLSEDVVRLEELIAAEKPSIADALRPTLEVKRSELAELAAEAEQSSKASGVSERGEEVHAQTEDEADQDAAEASSSYASLSTDATSAEASARVHVGGSSPLDSPEGSLSPIHDSTDLTDAQEASVEVEEERHSEGEPFGVVPSGPEAPVDVTDYGSGQNPQLEQDDEIEDTSRLVGDEPPYRNVTEPAQGASPPSAVAGVDLGVLVSLVGQSRPLAAAWLVRASGANPLLAEALFFNGVAFASGAGRLSPADAMAAGANLDVEALSEDRLSAIAAMTGAARAGLAAGWTDRNLLEGLAGSVHLDPEWQAMLDAVVEVSHRGYQHASARGAGVEQTSREDFADQARALLFELESATTKYHRATRVLHHLARSDEPLGAALQHVIDWSTGDDAAASLVRDAAVQLSGERSRARILKAADEGVSSPQQRRKDIVAGPAHQLHARIEDVSRLLAAAIEAMGRRQGGAADEADAERLLQAAEMVSVPEGGSDLASELLVSLRAWILRPNDAPPEEGSSVEDAVWRASLPLVDLHRDMDQTPGFVGARIEDLVTAMVHGAESNRLVERYIEHGNLPAASAIAERDPGLRDKVVLAGSNWRAKLIGLTRDADTLLARARSHHAMEDEEVSAVEGRLRALGQYDGDRFDLAVEEVETLTARILDRESELAERLKDDLKQVHGASHEDHERVLQLVQVGDLATAREYIYQLRRGDKLPSARESEEDDLKAFNQLIQDLSADARAHDVYASLAHDHKDELSEAGLKAWASIVLNPLRSTKQELPALLSLLGLETQRGGVSDVNAKGAGDARLFVVRAQPRDGSIVPGLGSRAHGRYYVTVVSPRRLNPTQVLSLIPEPRRDAANLVLIPQLLTPQERHHYLRAARELGVKALLVDSACVGYLAATAPGSFRSLQQITLPYATYTHYTPFVAGDVPEEVFVGRVDEARQITDPAGSLFVYGGRQLGKSALLRHIARTSSDGHSRHAIYIDLKAKMIGEAEDPSHLWVVLLEEFKRAGIIGPKATSGTPTSVVEHTRAWLKEDEGRSVLLLLDEADLFLESEARQRREGQRVVRFPNISPLKDLMESTNRRFKPVFAGLHQVQRFHQISNTPLAHGGKDILVGSLERDAGFELVERPFEALGFRFQSRDLVARILAFTNYQASLVQIVCDHLARMMTRKAPGPGQPPVTITSADIDRVVENQEVRHQLAERFRLTIALEDRYLVIALVVAVLSLEDGFAESYDEDEVFSWCRDYWPVGFGDMTLREFRLYLEEMRGLGVLVKRGDHRVAVRSPNVVSMLGRRADLEQQLEEGRFELPHDYNPRVSRRLLRFGQRDVRSPLTEQDLGILLPRSAGTPGLHLITGGVALGILDVVDVLATVASERGRSTNRLAAHEFADWITTSAAAPRRERDVVPLVDASTADLQTCEQLLELALRTVNRRSGQTIIVVLGSSFASSARSWESRAGVASVTTLTRWNDEALRSMNDAVFVDIADYRAKILDATSGWPPLVESVLQSGSRGQALSSILDAARSTPGDAATAASFLADVGADTLVERLVQWVDATSPDERIDPRDLDELYQVPSGTFSGVAAELLALDAAAGEPPELLLDSVVRRAARCILDTRG